MERKGKSLVAFVRHGERADIVEEPHLHIIPQHLHSEVDPPLTKQGRAQAKQTAKYLKDLFSKTDTLENPVVIKTSPFLRTIMTSVEIAKELGVDRVEVESSLSEYMEELCQFVQNPLPLLEIYTLTQKEFYNKYQLNRKIKIDLSVDQSRDTANGYYPETAKQGLLRALGNSK